MTWNCTNCGCQAIAWSLGECPQCFRPRAEVEEKPVEDAQPDGWPSGNGGNKNE